MTKKVFLFLSGAALLLSACSSSPASLFRKKTPLENYTEKLGDEGLHKTPEGRLWLAVKDTALRHPVSIRLPYGQAGTFSRTKPQALGLTFSARQGERLRFSFDKDSASAFVLYAELYRQQPGTGPQLVQAVDTNVSEFGYEVTESGDYLLRIQPQLFRAGSYRLLITQGPSLLFPVTDKKAAIGSVWGDSRDGGKRSHEGVDIFAPKGTAAVAAADGYISGVREGGLGGKTVWLRPEGKDVTLYYAHLDRQDVQEGQRVKAGEVVGLVGNTGNAQYTPAHLHFGVYGYGGAVDPFPYVNRTVKPVPVPSKKTLPAQVRLLKDQSIEGLWLPKNTLLYPLAFSGSSYLAERPDGRVVQVPVAVVAEAKEPLKKTRLQTPAALLAFPGPNAKPTQTLPAGTAVLVLGYFNRYAFVRLAGTEGWLAEAILEG